MYYELDRLDIYKNIPYKKFLYRISYSMKTMNTDCFSDAGKKKKIETECIEIVRQGNKM